MSFTNTFGRNKITRNIHLTKWRTPIRVKFQEPNADGDFDEAILIKAHQ